MPHLVQVPGWSPPLLAQTHQFLAANDKTNLISRCFKQAYRNVLRNLDQERKDAEKDLALPQLVRAERDLAFAEKASAAAALNLQTTYNVPNYEALINAEVRVNRAAGESGQPRCLKNIHIRQSARVVKRGRSLGPRERGPDLTDVFCFASSFRARGLNPCQSGALS
jgi:hypothetical protein